MPLRTFLIHSRRPQHQYLIGVWKKFVPNSRGDREGFKMPVREVSADMVKTARESNRK